MPQAVDAAAFLVDHEQRRLLRRHALHFGHQFLEVLRAVDVASEQHHRVGSRFRENALFEVGERLARQPDSENIRSHRAAVYATSPASALTRTAH
jgi:hypothetical protein